MGIGHTVEIIETEVDPSESEDPFEMSEATDLAILIIIIGLLVAALFYMYNKTVQTEQALAISLKLHKETVLQTEAKDAKDRDRVKEAKDVLRLLEKYERKKKKKSLEESSTDMSIEDKKRKKKEKKISEFGRVVLSVTEGGYKIPWIEGSGKLIELGPSLVKAILEPSQATPHRLVAPGKTA